MNVHKKAQIDIIAEFISTNLNIERLNLLTELDRKEREYLFSILDNKYKWRTNYTC